MLKFLRNVCLMACMFFSCMAHGAEMVNVEYIHKLIERDRGVKIEYAPTLEKPKFAANMKYLLSIIDIANKRLNGEATTNYGNGEYATMYAADTDATNTAVHSLIAVKPKFTVTTTPDTQTFEFILSATGRFVVDWGDGKSIVVNRDDTSAKKYSHTYANPGEYKIKMTGQARGTMPAPLRRYSLEPILLILKTPRL